MGQSAFVRACGFLGLVVCACDERPRDPVLARFAGGTVTESELRAYVRSQGRRAALRAQTTVGRRGLLRELIDEELQLAEALRRGLRRDREVRDAVNPLLAKRLVEDEIDPIVRVGDLPEEDVRAHYQERLAEFNVPERFRFGVIQAASRAKARAILEELGLARNNEEVFHILANGGDNVDLELRSAHGVFGYFTLEEMRRALPEDLWPAFDRLKTEKEKPETVQTPRGVFVVMTTGHQPAIETTYESIREALREQMLPAFRDRKIDEFLRAAPGHEVVRHDELLMRFRLSDAPPRPDSEP